MNPSSSVLMYRLCVIGPKGSGIEGATSMSMGKDFVTYARTKGVFAGVSVKGASITNERWFEQSVLWLRGEAERYCARSMCQVESSITSVASSGSQWRW